ncbi:Slc30a8 [Columba guinea]|nr:Slc30a8 [Columba guinea]
MSRHQKNLNELRQQQEVEDTEANPAYHCHGYSEAYEDRKREQHQARKKLCVASVICIFFMTAEITGEYFCSDISVWCPAKQYSCPFAPTLSAVTHDTQRLSLILHQTGHGHSHGAQAREHVMAPLERAALSNASLRAAFVHAIGDLFQSISVLISALIIFFKPEYKIADPICTFVFSIFVLATTITILRDILIVLMEGTSKGFAYDAVKARILAVEKVESVHNLHLWSLTMNQTILSAHVATANTADSQKILRDVTQALFEHYSFHSITIQMESGEDQKQDCVFCQEPRD